MKITVDIPEDLLRETMVQTGARTKREAIATAVLEFNRLMRLQKLAEKLGTFEGVMTQGKLRRMRGMG